MKLNGRVTITIDESGAAEITVRDHDAGSLVCQFTLNAKASLRAMRGLACVPCKVECGPLDRLGKRMVMDTLEFPMPDGAEHKDQKQIAVATADEKCPEGWIPDEYYNSQGSFFYKDNKPWARTTIRKWVTKGKKGGKGK